MSCRKYIKSDMEGEYKNNNGNYSLGLVPIHHFQPKLLTMSDYCYSDRLPSLDTRSSSATHGFPVLPVTAEPSGFPFPCRGVVSGMKCHSGSGAHFPEDVASVSGNPEPKLFVFLSPVTQSLKERFRFSLTF